MGVWDWVILLIVAGVCGAIGQAIAGVSRGGCLAAVAVGFIGAILGMWLQKLTGAPEIVLLEVGETKFPIVWSIIGAVLFVAVISLITRRDRRTD